MDVYQRRRLVALSAVVGVFVIVVLAVASGGDNEEPPAPVAATGGTGQQGPQTLSREQYRNEADRTCTEAANSLASIDPTDTADAARREAQVMSGMLRNLESLPPPERGARLADGYVDQLRTQVQALRERQLALESGDDATLIEADATIATAEVEAQAAAAEFGFEVCGDPAAAADATEVPVDPAPVDPAAPVEPEPVEPAPTEPPADDGGGTAPDSGGVTPDDGSGGVSP